MKYLLGFPLLFALSGAFGADHSSVLKSIQQLEKHYREVPAGLNCKSPSSKTERLSCFDTKIILLDRLDSMAYVYAVENATKQDADQNRTVDSAFAKRRNACPNAACIVSAYEAHITDSLGQSWEQPK